MSGSDSHIFTKEEHAAGGHAATASKLRNGTLYDTPQITPEKLREHAKVSGFGAKTDPREAQRRGTEAKKVSGTVPVLSPSTPLMKPIFASFAKRIRNMTRDGDELIEAIYEIFQRSRHAQTDALTIEAATWLADRGFGKPVQVGQLMDSEGNAVAFTLWSPATPENPNVITMEPKRPEEELPQTYLPPAASLVNPASAAPEDRDGYAWGVANDWRTDVPEKDQR